MFYLRSDYQVLLCIKLIKKKKGQSGKSFDNDESQTQVNKTILFFISYSALFADWFGNSKRK